MMAKPKPDNSETITFIAVCIALAFAAGLAAYVLTWTFVEAAGG